MTTNKDMSYLDQPFYKRTKSGTWVICGPASMIKEGSLVTVVKKDGSTKQELIESLGKPFDVNNKSYIYGYFTSSKKSQSTQEDPFDS